MTDTFAALSFVAQNGDTTDLWCTKSTGSWAGDNAQGRTFAAELLAYMRRTESPALLPRVVAAIGAKGDEVRCSGIVVGFFTAIGAAAIQY